MEKNLKIHTHTHTHTKLNRFVVHVKQINDTAMIKRKKHRGRRILRIR